MKDTTLDIFQSNGIQAPFSMVTEDAEMPAQGIADKQERNEIDLFANLKYVDRIVYPDGSTGELGFNAVIL